MTYAGSINTYHFFIAYILAINPMNEENLNKFRDV